MQEKIAHHLTRWPVLIIAAFLHGFLSPPLNSELHWILTPLPFIVILGVVPFLYVAITMKGRPQILRLLTWGAFHNFGTMWWLSKVNIDGLWAFILLGVFLLSLFQGLWYLASGTIIGFVSKRLPTLIWLIVPTVWLLVDYTKSIGDLAFPWMFEGYYFASMPRFSQVASITGVWGMTAFALMIITSVLLWMLKSDQWKNIALGVLVFFMLSVGYGTHRLHYDTQEGDFSVAIVQAHVDQASWDKRTSLGNQLRINDSLISTTPNQDLYVIPESGVYCYFKNKRFAQDRIATLRAKNQKSHIIFGTLDFHRYGHDSVDVYNATTHFDPTRIDSSVYRKQILVPFAETVPFKGVLPLLSRVEKMGVSNFVAGEVESVWNLGKGVKAAPIICYEGIFPNYIRRRVTNGANVIINTTNDGWFGRSQGPYHHALMTRLRAIESGVPMIRSANSGISYVVDSRGRFLAKSSLLKREIISVKLPAGDDSNTLYRRFGDWVIGFAGVVFLVLVGIALRTGRSKQ